MEKGKGAAGIFLKGLWVGSTMTVPGVSGGTMAVVAGIYEDLVRSVNGLRRRSAQSLIFLLQFALGAGIGFLVFAGIVTFLLQNEKTGTVTRWIFCALVLAGVPFLVKKSELKRISLRHIFCMAGGAASVCLLAVIPQGFFSGGEGITAVLLQMAGGFLIAVALILPGISASHMLYILGLYEIVMERIYTFQLLELLPLAAGGIVGTFLTADAIERLMKRYHTEVYMVIIGFVAGSIASLMP